MGWRARPCPGSRFSQGRSVGPREPCQEAGQSDGETRESHRRLFAPEATAGTLAQGKQLYREMKCWECHGDEGRADGPSTSTLKDDWGRLSSRMTLPAGSTRGRNSLRHRPSLCHGDGRDADALLRRFAQGAGALGAGSVRAVPGGSEGGGSAVHGNGCGEESRGPSPSDAMDPAWGKVPAVPVPLMLLWQRNERAADEVLVKALHNGKEIAFLLEWKDEEVSTRFRRDRHFADAAAVMFSLAPNLPLSRQAHFAMGEKKKAVNIWYWALDRRMDLVGVEPPAQPGFARGPVLAAGRGSVMQPRSP